jgi:immune inhibitor A
MHMYSRAFFLLGAILLSIVITTRAALAVMPPAPSEWYAKRLKTAAPAGIPIDMPQLSPAMQHNLDAANTARPRNIDKILVILVDFSDNPADQGSHPPSAYENLLFSDALYPTGSMYDFYKDDSYGLYLISGVVTAWITAPHPYAYYADIGGMGPYPKNSEGLLEDCVHQLDPIIDFSQFDTDGDGVADGIIMVHAGPGAEEGASHAIWSHSGAYTVATNDGVTTGRYACVPESFMDGSLIAIGVFCHEYGHMLGLPDLYGGISEGAGIYCLMAGGSWGALPGNPERPTQMCAEMKYRMGWLAPTDVTGNEPALVVPPAETNPVCYRITNPAYPDEYFLLENRSKLGFDSLMRGEGGLLIWHIDRNGVQGDTIRPYVYLEQADGSSDLEKKYAGSNRDKRTNRGDAGDFFPGGANNHVFDFASKPGSICFDGIHALLTLKDITFAQDTVRAALYTNPDIALFRMLSNKICDTVESSLISNRNLDADSGETVDLVVKLACTGKSVGSLTGTVSTGDPRVAIVRATTDFGPAASNSYAENNAVPFRITVLSPSNYPSAQFHLELTADGSNIGIDFSVNLNRQKILLVVDNNGSNWSDNLISISRQAGASYDIYNVAEKGSPRYDDLIPYQAVLWTTAAYFGKSTAVPSYDLCLNSAELQALQKYLDHAGRLGLFSQNYLYDLGINSFATDYLYISTAIITTGSTHEIGDPAGYLSGFDGHSKPWSYYDYTNQISPRSGARAILHNETSGGFTTAISYPNGAPVMGSFATTYCAFGLERFDSTSLDQFLTGWTAWILTNINVDVPLPITPKDGMLVTIPQPEFKWTASAGVSQYHIQLATDTSFSTPLKDTIVAGTSVVFPGNLPEQPYYWRVGAKPASNPETPYSPLAPFTIAAPYVCGDANGDRKINVADAVYLINYVFKHGTAPVPIQAGDANADGKVNVADVVYLINRIFKAGPPPLCP